MNLLWVEIRIKRTNVNPGHFEVSSGQQDSNTMKSDIQPLGSLTPVMAGKRHCPWAF